MPFSKESSRTASPKGRLLFVIVAFALVPFLGCPKTDVDPRSLAAKHADLALPANDGNASSPDADEASSLLERIDRVLASNLKGRRLSTDVHGAWQIFHGVLAYGPDFEVQSGDGTVKVIDYVLRGGTLKGFALRSGDRFESLTLSDSDAKETGLLSTDASSNDAVLFRGIRADMDPGTKLGQGHRDQWLAYLASCSLPIDQVIQTLDGPRRLDLWLRQVEWDVPLNFEREYSWTLMALMPYRTTQHRWVARDGQDYSIETLLRSEIDQLSPASACGGAHRLTAISIALNKRRSEGGSINGVWSDAQDLIDAAIEQSFEFQNADGSFSSNYFEREGWSLDVSTAIGTTGHTLEFIAKGGSNSVITSGATINAANCLCKMLEQTANLDLECGALYHALSGLQIYRRRLSSAAS